MIVIRELKAVARARYEKSIRLGPTFRVPYASHLPVLFAVGTLINPKNLLEYGSGFHSTCTFLRTEAFPNLELVKSFENDQTWYEQMRDRLAQDKRATLEFVDNLIAKSVDLLDLRNADLVFIDDSINLERALTIKAVAATRISGVPIIIHDVNIRQYRWPIRRFDHRFIFDALTPQTGVVWNGEWPLGRYLPRFNEIISKNSEVLEPDDAEAWLPLFRAVLEK